MQGQPPYNPNYQPQNNEGYNEFYDPSHSYEVPPPYNPNSIKDKFNI